MAVAHPWEHSANTEPVYEGVEERAHHPHTLADSLGDRVSQAMDEITEGDLAEVEKALGEIE